MPRLAKGKTYGKITDQNNKGLNGFKVELWDDDYPDADDRMGVTYTDANGNYKFRYPGGWDPRIPGSTSFRPDIYITVSIKNSMGRWCQLKKSRTYKNHKLRKDKKIDLKITIAPKQKKRVPFDISKFAFKFPNAFNISDIDPNFPGNVDMGLCGGMSAGALHRFKHRCPVPTQTTTPHSGPLFDELFKRQLITLSDGQVAIIWDWQRSPDLPHPHTPHSIRYRQKGQWQLLKSYIDKGKPAILCLIRMEGYMAKIWKNHQVVAIGYEYEPTPRNLKVEIYDPNDKNGSNFLHLCLSGGRLGAHQINSAGDRINFRGFFVMATTDKASKEHI
jgi:hypothetical protein